MTPRHKPKVLVVGPSLVEDSNLRRALTQSGFRTASARSETEALLRLAGMSPDLVVSEYALGRSDGATLVQATHDVPGIERIPIVLLDDTRHKVRRDIAKTVGAAGYVIRPDDPARFVARLGELISAPSARRFTRYPRTIAARVDGLDARCLATEVGRGGIFLRVDREIDLHEAMRCEIALPELARSIRFDGEVLYRGDAQGGRAGLGLRFAAIAPEDEAALISYLTWIESQT